MTLQPFLFWKVNLLLSTPNLPYQCTCMKTGYDTNRWNEGFKDDIFERHDDECSEVWWFSIYRLLHSL
jgi:hypothetical protein